VLDVEDVTELVRGGRVFDELDDAVREGAEDEAERLRVRCTVADKGCKVNV
jgi:hypothetical protein